MRKNIKEPKSKKINPQNKLKKALYPQNSKPITLETYIGINNQKAKKKKNYKPKQKTKNEEIFPPPSGKLKKRNISENIQTNKSQNNTNFLELDYLNFSRIDLGFRKLNSSFDEDMFNSKIVIKEKKELASNRYNGVESSFDTSKAETNNNNNYIKESKEKLLKTPSTVCNYYDKSEAATSQKKNNINNNKIEEKNELRKNLDKLYEESKNNEIDYINVNKANNQNIINWKLKDSIKITKNKEKEKEKEKKDDEYSKTLNENKKELNKLVFDIKRDFAKNQSQKKVVKKNNNINVNNYKSEIPYKNNLMENYLNGKINKRKNSYNTSSSKKNVYYENMNNIPKEISKTLKYTNDNINSNINNNANNTQDIKSLININFNSTINANNNNQNITNNKFQTKKSNNTTNGIYYINSNTKNYKQISKHSAQKPIILCYDQMKYDSYFVTPKNTKKIKKGKVQTSNKSTKFDSNSRGTGTGTNNIKNRSNKNNNDYNLIINTLLKAKNKSFNKNLNNNFIRNNIDNNNNNRIIYIHNINNNNLKNHKSSSLLIRQNGVLSNNKGIHSQNSNSNINTILQLLNSGVKKNSQLLQDLLSKVNYSNSNTKSPLKKYKSSNALKISKTLTEHNILNRMQVTPKYNKIPKGGNALTTTLVKRNIYIGSNGKNVNNKGIKYHNSTVKKNNNQFFGSNNNYKDVLTNLFNHKTQSDFKTNKYFILNNSNINSNNGNKNNNVEYGMDKHIKQKLLDRMNNATNNGWQYVFRGNKNNNNNGNKKVLMENLSEIMKSPDKKDFINNDTIISNESEDENEKK